jgi:hypothetical protein
MKSSFHFVSAQEFTPAILDTIKQTYKEKPISIYIQEDEPFVPYWQIQEVKRRDGLIEKNPEYLLDCDVVISELEKELEMV